MTRQLFDKQLRELHDDVLTLSRNRKKAAYLHTGTAKILTAKFAEATQSPQRKARRH